MEFNAINMREIQQRTVMQRVDLAKQALESRIRKAAADGETRLFVPFNTDALIVHWLEALGFVVTADDCTTQLCVCWA